MLDIFESLPLSVTTLIVAAISVLVVAGFSRVAPIRLMWLVALVAPLVVSYVVYWMPYWVSPSSHAGAYIAWELLVLAIWGGAGIVASLMFVSVLAIRRRGTRSHV
jgi:hypothetical protein